MDSARITRTSACMLVRIGDSKPFDECYKDNDSVFDEIIVLTDRWVDDDGETREQVLSPVSTGRKMIMHDLVSSDSWETLTTHDIGLNMRERFDRYEYLSDCDSIARLKALGV
jgi:hypothetical protein